MIQFIETYYSNGTMSARLACDDLPIAYDGKRYSYNIQIDHDGKCKCKSRAEGNGSIRYHVFADYNSAMSHGIKWAKRKLQQK